MRERKGGGELPSRINAIKLSQDPIMTSKRKAKNGEAVWKEADKESKERGQ